MRVFIGDVFKVLPEIYSTEYLVQKVYSPERVGEKTNRFVHRYVKSLGIKQKPIVLDLDKLPEKKLKKEDYSPLKWGEKVVKRFSSKLGKENIGFLSISYNISYYEDFLPNLVSRIVENTDLNLDTYPEELPFYGCASGLFSLKSAVEYCKKHNKAAVVFIFDQCSHIGHFTFDSSDPSFKKTLKTNFLFSDGGVGLLIIPETMKDQFDTAVEVLDIKLDHIPGDEIKIQKGRFILGNKLKDIIPPIVSSHVVKPLLKKYDLDVNDIEEWAIHQGGYAILERFKEKEILGLSDLQIRKAEELFEMYGNLSSPSSFFIFDSFFHEKKEKKGSLGMIIGFGAGYYIGSALYKWA
ncbi:3-oxoacyl-[acyl-carrier-protein] synthase III C-terminal domain-containing protein [Persephonella sp.]